MIFRTKSRFSPPLLEHEFREGSVPRPARNFLETYREVAVLRLAVAIKDSAEPAQQRFCAGVNSGL